MNKNREKETVQETEVTPVETNEVGNEAPVETENTETTEITEGTEVAEKEPKKKSAKLFNLLCLGIALFMLVADVYLLIAMNTGIIKIGSTTFTAVGIVNYLQRAIAIISGSFSVSIIGDLLIMAAFLVVYIVFYINILIGVIKSIIKIFSFFKLGREKSETELAFSAYIKTINKNYGLGITFIALSLMAADGLTGVGVGVIVLGSIIYAGLAVFKQLFITPAEEGETLFGRIMSLVIELGRRAVMFAIAFLVAANITACMSAFFQNIDYLIDELSLISDNIKVTELIGNIYVNVVNNVLMIIPFAIIVSIVGKIAKYYVFNNGKTDINKVLFRNFVALFIITLLLLIAQCVMLGMAGLGGVGDAVKGSMGILLASVAGAVIAFASRVKETLVAR